MRRPAAGRGEAIGLTPSRSAPLRPCVVDARADTHISCVRSERSSIDIACPLLRLPLVRATVSPSVTPKLYILQQNAGPLRDAVRQGRTRSRGALRQQRALDDHGQLTSPGIPSKFYGASPRPAPRKATHGDLVRPVASYSCGPIGKKAAHKTSMSGPCRHLLETE